jgi:hypothetical protein
MLLRDAQEEARILFAALRNAGKGEDDLLTSHVAEAAGLLDVLKGTEPGLWCDVSAARTRTVGLVLLVGLALANALKVDSTEALKEVLLEESP